MESTESLVSRSETQDVYQHIRQQLNSAAIRFREDALFVFSDSLSQFAQAHLHLLDSVDSLATTNRDRVREAHLRLIQELRDLWEEFSETQIPVIQQYLQVGCRRLAQEVQGIIDASPESLTITLSAEQIEQQEKAEGASGKRRNWKLWSHQLTGTPIVQTVKFRRLLQHDWQAIYLRNVHSVLNTLNLTARDHFLALGVLLKDFQKTTFPGQIRPLEPLSPSAEERVEQLKATLKSQNERLVSFMEELHALMEIRLQNEMQQLDINQQLKRSGWDTQRQLAIMSQFGANWAGNMRLLFQKQKAEFQLQEIQAQMIWMGKGILAELNFRCFTSTESSLLQLQDEVQVIPELIAKEKWEELQQLSLDPSALLLLPDERIISGAVAHLVQHISNLPENIDLVTQQAWEPLGKGEADVLKIQPFALAEMVNYLTKTYYLAPLEEALLHLPDSFKKLYHRVQGGIRLITFHLPNGEGKVEDGNLATVLQRSEAQFRWAREQLAANRQGLLELLQRIESEVLALLSLERLYEEANSWNLSTANRVAPDRKLHDLRRLGTNWVRNKFDWLTSRLNQAQDQLLLADIQQNLEPDSPGIASIRGWSRLISPNASILQHLPYYYKQLFVGNQRIARKLMVGRDKELTQASRVASMMQGGLGGAMMIVGEPQSGKTYFSEYVADVLFSGKVIQIVPPTTGSRKIADLKAAFRNRLRGRGSLVQMIQAELPGTVFLLDDLELWWERSQNGEEIIRQLFKVIDQVGTEYPFVINCNQYAYGLINRMLGLEAHTSDTIYLQPLSLQKVEECLLDRHKSSALQFQLNGTMEEDIRPRQFRRFFRRLYHYSRGNIGFSLRMWLSCIQEIHQESVSLRPLPSLESPKIENPDWLVLLTQFVLHKHLNEDRLKRIYPLDSPLIIKERLFQLHRAALISELSPGLFELNPYMTSFVLHLLQKDQLL